MIQPRRCRSSSVVFESELGSYPLSFAKKEDDSSESSGTKSGKQRSATVSAAIPEQNDEKDGTMGLGYKDAGFLVDAIWSLRGYFTASMTMSEEGVDPTMLEMQEYMYEKAVGELYEDDSVFRIITTKGLEGIEERKHLYFTNVHGHPNKYDATGATLLHQVYYHHKYSMGRELVRAFPDYGLEGYASVKDMKRMKILDQFENGKEIMPFTGQTLLHMTLLHRNHFETEWLMDFYRKRSLEDLRTLLSARVTGSTFLPGNKTYYGETALHFAVCSNDCELVNLVLSYISSLPDSRDFVFAPDSHGNNVLHLCVLQNLPEMYDHIKMRTMTMIRQEILTAWHFSLSQSFNKREVFMHPKIAHQVPGGKGYLRIPSKLQFPDTDAAIIKKILEEMCREDGMHPLRDRFEEVFFIDELAKSSFADDSAKALNPKTKEPIVSEVKKLLQQVLGAEHGMLALVDGETLKDCLDPLAPKIDIQKLHENIIVRLVHTLMGKQNAMYDIAAKRSNQIVDVKSLDDVEDKAALGVIAVIEKSLFEFWLDGKNEELTVLVDNWLDGKGRELNDGAIKQLFEDRLLNGLNMKGLTPLALAAVKGKKCMFELLIKESVVPRWQLGPIKSYIFDLDGLEFPVFLSKDGKELYLPPVDPKVVQVKGAINWICAKDDDDLKDLISIPEIHAVLAVKWERIGKPIIMRNGIFALCATLGVTALACLAYESPSRGDGEGSGGTAETNLVGALALHFSYVAFMELEGVRELGLDYWGYHGGIRGVAIYERLCVSAMMIFFVLTLFCRWLAYLDATIGLPFIDCGSHDSAIIGYYQASLGSCCLAHWMHMLLYVMAMDSFGPFVMKVAKILQKDIFYFCQIYAVIVLGFGISISVITDKITVDGVKMSGPEHALFCIATLVKQTFNVNTGVSHQLESNHVGKSVENFYGILVFFYSLVVNISLLNLLIAMMTHTYDDYEDIAGAKILAEKYNLMEGVIRKLGETALSKLEHKYTFSVKLAEHSMEPSSSVEPEPLGVEDSVGELSKVDSASADAEKPEAASGASRALAAPEGGLKCTRRFFEMNVEDPNWSHLKENHNLTSTRSEETEFARREDSSSRVSMRIMQSSFWVNDNDDHPPPSQVISYEDVARRVWRPIDVNLQDYCLYYLEKLREEDRRLVIQPFKRNVLLIIHPQNDFHDKMSDKTNIAQDRLQHEDAAKKSAKTPFAVNDVVSLRDLKDGRDVVYTIVHINEHDSTADLRYEDSEFSPTLPVTGAYEDSLRIAELINNQWEHIDEIFVTQDTHFKNHISNRWYWKKGENAPEDLATMDGAHPPPFTAIKHDHIRDKIWVPDFSTGECGLMTRKEVEDERYGYSLYYTAELERQKKFLHFIWPDHCIVGSSDHEVTYEERERLSCTSLTADDGRKDEPDPNLSIEDCFTSQGHHIIITIQEALANWRRNWQEKEHVHKRVKYVRTGTNANTEMYSVLRAEVADSRDVLTGLNKRFLSDINSADKLYVCGQALSHCVNYTLRDLFKYWIRKPSDITLLVDGSSAVGGFEQAAYEFIKEMKDEGIRLRTCEAVNKHLGGLKRVHRGGGAACRHDGCTGWNAPQKQFPNDPLFVEIDGAS